MEANVCGLVAVPCESRAACATQGVVCRPPSCACEAVVASVRWPVAVYAVTATRR